MLVLHCVFCYTTMCAGFYSTVQLYRVIHCRALCIWGARASWAQFSFCTVLVWALWVLLDTFGIVFTALCISLEQLEHSFTGCVYGYSNLLGHGSSQSSCLFPNSLVAYCLLAWCHITTSIPIFFLLPTIANSLLYSVSDTQYSMLCIAF